ncbi:MAG: Rrf2 family transcriptional regulator [Cyanobacteriota bacterium]
MIGARLGRQEIHALRALVTLARDVTVWRSVTSLAEQHDLPAPMLEQLLLRLRRAVVLEAGRGRLGGYRLTLHPQAISLARVFSALEPPVAAGYPSGDEIAEEGGAESRNPGRDAAEHVAAALERRLQRALERELAAITLEDLLFDLRSSQASLEDEGGLMLP